MSGEKPTLTVVAGREGPAEGPNSNAAKIAVVAAKSKKKRGRRAKAIEPTAGSKIIRDCVVYAQSIAAYRAGFKADPTGDFDYTGSDKLGEGFVMEADTAIRRLLANSPAFPNGDPLTRDELFAKAIVLQIMFESGEGTENNERAYVRFFAKEVMDYLRAEQT